MSRAGVWIPAFAGMTGWGVVGAVVPGAIGRDMAAAAHRHSGAGRNPEPRCTWAGERLGVDSRFRGNDGMGRRRCGGAGCVAGGMSGYAADAAPHHHSGEGRNPAPRWFRRNDGLGEWIPAFAGMTGWGGVGVVVPGALLVVWPGMPPMPPPTVIPAQAGIQNPGGSGLSVGWRWIPAFAVMTGWGVVGAVAPGALLVVWPSMPPMPPPTVIPAQAGIQNPGGSGVTMGRRWIPAFAGMTGWGAVIVALPGAGTPGSVGWGVGGNPGRPGRGELRAILPQRRIRFVAGAGTN